MLNVCVSACIHAHMFDKSRLKPNRNRLQFFVHKHMSQGYLREVENQATGLILTIVKDYLFSLTCILNYAVQLPVATESTYNM